MSTYVSMQGEITYPNRASFDSMVDTLKTCGWMDKDGFFVDECKERVSHASNIDDAKLMISIPCSHWRNLGRITFFTPGATGYIVGTCTDGCFEGWTNTDGVETNYNLEKWAKENMGEDGVPPDPDTETEAYLDWQQVVEYEFFQILE